VNEALRWLPEGPTPTDEANVVAAPPGKASARERILVVDDNADMRDYLTRLLGQSFEVEAVADGRAALAAIDRVAPDLILTDIMMPHVDGFQFLARLRAEPRNSALPIIFLSARAGEDSRIEGLKAKADDYLTKPFSARELLARVQSQLEAARTRGRASEEMRQRAEQIEALLNSAPIGVYLVDADFRLRHINPTALLVFGAATDNLVGRDFDEVIHILWSKEYADEIVRIFRNTLETGESYEAPERSEYRADRGVTEYYEWRVDRIPLPDGRNGVVCYFRDISTQVQARRKIASSEERLSRVLATEAVGVIFFDKASGVLIEANDAFLKISGYSRGEVEAKQLTWRKMTPPEYYAVSEQQMERLQATGRIGPYEKEYIRKDGKRSWMMFAGRDLGDGTLVEFAMDISDRKRSEDHIRFLMREVNHRSKNLLTLIQAVARQTAASGGADFADRFSDRIQALSASQDVLVKSDWKAVPIDELIRSQLAHFADVINERITMTGPRLGIMASAAQTLAMSLHELATNAAKYGSLSQDSGRIDISWRVRDEAGRPSTFEISWVETGGPPVFQPSHRGFGTTVLASMTKLALGGDVRLEYLSGGVTWRLNCPVGKVMEVTGPLTIRHAASVRNGRRVLVVDDEALISLEIASLLEGAGLSVVGPVTTVKEALALIDKEGCDAAVLDINLGPETSESVARKLREDNIPFITVSGFSRDQQPSIFQTAPFLPKPLRGDRLVAAVKQCLSESSPVQFH
jgi:PAS domain S-box-containing protein